MKKTDVLVIGGSAAGMVVSLTGKSASPDKNFIMIKKQKDVMVPCGIPYIFGTAGLTEAAARKENIDVLTGMSEGPDTPCAGVRRLAPQSEGLQTIQYKKQ